ncbi:MAG: hypothetical protein HYV42_01445 [Candidatus Magasanikbacteria bacterium]|nr:hypothetical protein [Candidatus Magasanikbacteria bacterium]
MRLLVIEDSPWNIASARLTLKDHELVIATDAESGFQALVGRYEGTVWRMPSYDAALTDLFLPARNFVGFGNMRSNVPPESLPAGLIFALHAANLGIPAAIVTDADHHQDWVCNLLDLVGGSSWNDEQSQRVSYVEARQCGLRAVWRRGELVILGEDDDCPQGTVIKDWRLAMKLAHLIPFDEEDRKVIRR